MISKFIETLVTAGVVNGAQIERAMHYESGSSLAERLLSLGYGSEEDFYKILKNKLKQPTVDAASLFKISQDVISFFPKSLIEKHHVLPFSVKEGVISVAMFDPTADFAIRELYARIESGSFRIRAFAALASDLSKALNRHFSLGLPESFKYGEERLITNYKGPKIPPLVLTPAKEEDLSKLPPIPGSKEKTSQHDSSKVKELEEKIKKMQEDFEKLSKMVEEPDVKLKPETKLESKKEEVKKEEKEEKKLDKIVEDLEPENICPVEYSKEKDIAESMTEGLDYDEDAPDFKDIKDLSEEQPAVDRKGTDVDFNAIESAGDKDSILKKTIAELQKLSSRSLLLFLRADSLFAAKGAGLGISENYEGYSLSLDKPSIFKEVYETRSSYSGPVKSETLMDDFIKHFGNQAPMSITLVPAVIQDQVFALIYVEETPPGEVEKIANSMSKAFSKLLG